MKRLPGPKSQNISCLLRRTAVNAPPPDKHQTQITLCVNHKSIIVSCSLSTSVGFPGGSDGKERPAMQET